MDWNILMVAFLGRIDNGPSQLLLLYDLCLHRPMQSLFHNSANVICTRAVISESRATQAERVHLPAPPQGWP